MLTQCTLAGFGDAPTCIYIQMVLWHQGQRYNIGNARIINQDMYVHVLSQWYLGGRVEVT